MKYAFLFFAPALILAWAAAPAENKESPRADSLYALVYTTGEGWDTAKQFYEQAYFHAHSRHLSRLRKAGTIKIGGRFSDKGLLLLSVKNGAEARALVEQDSSVRYKTFKAEMYPFDLFYEGCVK